jgi:hypothetical protein
LAFRFSNKLPGPNLNTIARFVRPTILKHSDQRIAGLLPPDQFGPAGTVGYLIVRYSMIFSTGGSRPCKTARCCGVS